MPNNDRPRRSLRRALEERYGGGRRAPGQRPGTPAEPRIPVIYPVTRRRKRRPHEPGKGVIAMSVQQFVALALVFVLIAWGGAAAVSYGVVELSRAEGPRGEQGLPGETGQDGKQGPIGLTGAAENDDSVERLATLWAVQQLSSLQGGIPVELKDENVLSCVEWVLTGQPDVGACPGFTAGD